MTQRDMLKCILGSALLVATATRALHGCNVPVFRYALERWQPDRYVCTVFTTGDVSQAEQALIDWLRDGSVNHGTLDIVIDDVSQAAEERAARRRAHADIQALPWCALDYPLYMGVPTNVWSGPLERAALQRLVTSPVREELARRLTGGDALVWVLLECGDAPRDAALAARLAALIESSRTNTLLPHQIDSPAFADAHQEYDTNIVFRPSLIRLARTNDAEAVLIRTLTHVYPELLTTNEPVAFPVIGRGRAFTALIGDEITQEFVMAWSTLIAGPCACEIKEQNPGIDLFMPCDWDALIDQRMVYYTAPPVTGFDALRPPDAADDSEPVAHVQSHAACNVALVVGAVVILVMLGTLVIVIRRI